MGMVVRQRRDDRDAAGAARRGRRDGAAHRRGGRRRRAGAGARRTRARVGIVGCGLHGAWAARCLAAAGLGPGVCYDPRRRRRSGWPTSSAGGPAAAPALACDVVTCVTPGHAIVVDAGDLRPGMHLNMLGADGPGKAEATVGAVASCALFCDEWAQASHGGELTGAVEAGLVTRDDVTDLGAVLAGEAPGRPGPRRSRCSTRPVWRSRTSRSPRPRWTRIERDAWTPRS